MIEKDQEVHIEYQLSRKLYAPVTEGDFIGEITYLLGDEVLAKRVVTVKNTVKRIDFLLVCKKNSRIISNVKALNSLYAKKNCQKN